VSLYPKWNKTEEAQLSEAIPLISMDQVFHVGDIVDDRSGRPEHSLEAFCLSVSLHPEDWTRIARIGGSPTWEMNRPSSSWIDALSIEKDLKDEIIDWGLGEGLVQKTVFWRAWSSDEEGEPRFIRFNKQSDAIYESDPEDEDPDVYVDSEDGHLLSENAMGALKRWPEASDAFDGLLILFAERVLSPQNDDVVGIWWDETYDPDALSCPRGALLPAKISEFEKETLEPTDQTSFEP
jgi:hypothetical protein